MSVSSVSSSSAYALQWPSLSGTDSAKQSGAPSDALISLFQAFQGGGRTDGMGPPSPPPDGSSGGASQFSSDTMSTMISMLGGQNSGASPLDNLVGKFDSDGDGKISQSEFEQAMGSDADKTKADALFAKMDKDGDGTVTKDELARAIQKAHGHHHHHGGAQQADGSQGADPLQSLLSGQGADGSTSQSSTNSDGSTTTTVTYADGTKIVMTTPASASASAGSSGTSGTDALNAISLKTMIENMIAMQAQMFAQQQQTGTSVSV